MIINILVLFLLTTETTLSFVHIKYQSPSVFSNSLRRMSRTDTEDGILSSLYDRSLRAFDSVSSPRTALTPESLSSWESSLDEIAQEVKAIKEPKLLLKLYESVLQKAAPNLLDPLQITTFEIIANTVVDTLISLFPKNTPITALIEDLTDKHLEFIERFRDYFVVGSEDEE